MSSTRLARGHRALRRQAADRGRGAARGNALPGQRRRGHPLDASLGLRRTAQPVRNVSLLVAIGVERVAQAFDGRIGAALVVKRRS
jgi:hypothetical protein